MADGETVLLGVDLVKDIGRLSAVYDDAAGVTAAFNRNALHVLNNVAQTSTCRPSSTSRIWDTDNEWIEMRLRARRPMTVRLAALDLTVTFAEGEEMRTEISAKFRRPGIEAELDRAGFSLEGWWTDPADAYALALVRR